MESALLHNLTNIGNQKKTYIMKKLAHILLLLLIPGIITAQFEMRVGYTGFTPHSSGNLVNLDYSDGFHTAFELKFGESGLGVAFDFNLTRYGSKSQDMDYNLPNSDENVAKIHLSNRINSYNWFLTYEFLQNSPVRPYLEMGMGATDFTSSWRASHPATEYHNSKSLMNSNTITFGYGLGFKMSLLSDYQGGSDVGLTFGFRRMFGGDVSYLNFNHDGNAFMANKPMNVHEIENGEDMIYSGKANMYTFHAGVYFRLGGDKKQRRAPETNENFNYDPETNTYYFH